MRIVSVGTLCFAAAMAALGLLGLITGDFASVWQPVPKWIPGRELLAYCCALMSLGGGIALLFKHTAVAAARILFAYLILWLLLLRLPNIFMRPLAEVSWSGCGETGVTVAAAWILWAGLDGGLSFGSLRFAVGNRGYYLAHLLFGGALIPCGLAHFAYSKDTAGLVPSWLPWHLGWAYLTGTAYLLAGIGTMFQIYARLAALFTTIMMASFTVLIWIPMVANSPKDSFQWTALCISSALTASAWVVSDSYKGLRELPV